MAVARRVILAVASTMLGDAVWDPEENDGDDELWLTFGQGHTIDGLVCLCSGTVLNIMVLAYSKSNEAPG